MNAVAADAALSLVFAGSIGAVLYGPWQTACTDYFRQPLFEQRDALFDLADRKGIPFNDVAYVEARSTINAFIRFAHRISFSRLVLHSRLNQALNNDEISLWPDLGDDWDQESRDTFAGITKAVERSMVGLMLLKSPVLWMAILLAGLLMVALASVLGLKRAFRGPYNAIVDRIGTEAILSERSLLM